MQSSTDINIYIFSNTALYRCYVMFAKELRDMQLNNLLYKSKEGAVHWETDGFILKSETTLMGLWCFLT